jgi:hypothetical protein
METTRNRSSSKRIGYSDASQNYLQTSNFSYIKLNSMALVREQTKTIYKYILKPIWIYGIQLFGMAPTSNKEILEHFLSKTLNMVVDAPWYVPNTVI